MTIAPRPSDAATRGSPAFGVASAACLMAIGSAAAPLVDGAGKILVVAYPVLQIVWMRYVGHAVVAGGVALARRDGLADLKPSPAQTARGAVQFGSSLLLLAALARLSLNTALVLVFLAPLLVVLVRHALGHAGTDRTSVVIAAIGALGVGLSYAPHLTRLDPFGIACALGAAVLLATYFLLTGSAGRRVGSVVASFHTALPGALLGLPLVSTGFVVPRADDWPLLLALGLGSAFSHWLICAAMRTRFSSAITPVAYVEVPVGAIYALLIFGHRPTLPEVTGGIVVTLAGIACAWRLKRMTAVETQPAISAS